MTEVGGGITPPLVFLTNCFSICYNDLDDGSTGFFFCTRTGVCPASGT
jgi:hypothetical protein